MNNTMRLVVIAAPLLFALAAACSGDKADSDGSQRDASSSSSTAPASAASKSATARDQDQSVGAKTTYKTSSRNLVQWKRAAVIEADLSRALELAPDELCKELGDKNCIRDVHLVPLGGNEPYVSGLMKPSVEPLATTPAVIDRVLLSACNTRAQRDAEGQAKVFTKLKLDQKVPAADDPAVKATVSELYHRLLSREPSTEEMQLVSALAGPDESDNDKHDGDEALSAREFAALACFTIGSSTEFLFF